MNKFIIKDPFRLMPISIFLGGLKIAFIASLIFRLYFDISRYGFNALFVYGIACLAVFFLLVPILFIQSKELRRKTNPSVGTCEKYGILISSKSLRKKYGIFLPNFLGFIFFKEKATYQKFYFRDETGKEDYFYDVVTSGKAEIFRSVFSADVSFRGLGIWTKQINSFNEIPLKIIYDSSSHMLVSVSCVSDYSYTDEQRGMIGQLNTRYLLTPYENISIKGRYKNKLASKDSFPAAAIVRVLFLFSIAVSVFTIGGISFVYDVISLNKETIELFGGIVVLYFSVKIICAPWSLFLDRINRKENTVVINEAGILKYLSLISNSDAIYNDVHLLYFDDYVCCLKCFYLKNGGIIRYPDRGASDYFYLSLSNRKLNLIHSLYKVVPTEAFGFYSTCFKLLNDVPLNLVIRKKSRILKSIAPVEGYEYSEAQLAAIEKFNVLYP